MLMQLLNNPVFLGAIGVIISGAVMYVLRSIPKHSFELLVRRVTSSITVTADSPAYAWAEEWLANQPFARRAKRTKISSTFNNGSRLIITPGYGEHVFWNGGHPIMVHREAQPATKAGASGDLLRVTTLDFGRKTVEKIYQEIVGYAESLGSMRIMTHDNWGLWQPMQKKQYRKLGSVFVPQPIKDQIIGHIDWYLKSREWYHEMGIPYRTGMLFYGPPGTGKTSLVQAIAGVFDLTVYMMSPADLDSDASLKRAMARVTPRSILLIEDIDRCIAQKKEDPKPKKSDETTAPATEASGPTLSGVLNAIDGIAAADGRILIMTTNHIEKLDDALIRDGRVDLKIQIDAMQKAEVVAMAQSFFPKLSMDKIREMVDCEPSRTGAQWQTHFVEILKRNSKSQALAAPVDDDIDDQWQPRHLRMIASRL